ncbi:hypothetical protein AB3S75_000459 [Citrus x aurantiifolia]
MLLSLKLLQE